MCNLCAFDEDGDNVVDGVEVVERVAAHGQEVGILSRLERAGGLGDPAYLCRDEVVAVRACALVMPSRGKPTTP